MRPIEDERVGRPWNMVFLALLGVRNALGASNGGTRELGLGRIITMAGCRVGRVGSDDHGVGEREERGIGPVVGDIRRGVPFLR